MDYNELLIDCVCDLTQEESQEALESIRTGDMAQSTGLLRLAEIIRSRASQEPVKTYTDIDAVYKKGVFAQMGIDEELDYRERARDLADSVKNGGL